MERMLRPDLKALTVKWENSFFFVVCLIQELLQLIEHIKIDVIFVIIDIKVDVSLLEENERG